MLQKLAVISAKWGAYLLIFSSTPGVPKLLHVAAICQSLPFNLFCSCLHSKPVLAQMEFRDLGLTRSVNVNATYTQLPVYEVQQTKANAVCGAVELHCITQTCVSVI